MRLLVRAALVACAMLCATGASAQSRAYAGRMPMASQLIAAYPEPEKQSGACYIMRDALQLMIGLRYYRDDVSATEKARDRDYLKCITDRNIKPGATPEERRAHSETFGRYRYDDVFREEVWNRFFPARDRPTLDQRFAADKARDKARADQIRAENEAAFGPSLGTLISRFWYFGFFALLGIWAVLRFLRWLQPLRYTAGETHFSSGGRKFKLYENSGVLAGLQHERHTTHTPGTETRNQYGAVIHSTAATTTTTNYQTVYITDEGGRERASTLTDWGVTARPGNLVSVIWAIREGKKTGNIFQFRNFTLDQSWTRPGPLKELLGMGWITGLMLFFFFPILVSMPLLILMPMLISDLGGMTSMLMLAGKLGWMVMAGLLIFAYFTRRSRIAQFKREVLPSIGAIARRNADEAASLSLGPITRAD